MRHNVRDEKGRFVKKSSCKCNKATDKCCKHNTKGTTDEECIKAFIDSFDMYVNRFVDATITAAMDVTMSCEKDIASVAQSELDWSEIPEDLEKDLKKLNIKTIYDFGKYIVVSREIVNEAIEIMGRQLINRLHMK